MKATLLFYFALLSCVSLLVGAKSIKSRHVGQELTCVSDKEDCLVRQRLTDEQKEADANKCTCEIPADEQQENCDCSKQDMKKCQNDEKKSCDCPSASKTEKGVKSEQCQCKNADDTEKNGSHRNSTKRCNCNCSPRSKTGHAAVSQETENPSILAVAPIMQQADGSQPLGGRRGKGSKKCCCCDCCHDCCCHDCCCHCCEPCCCCCHCCEPCCCCCHECCCPCCCHCCHCCPCCCHCCCKKSQASAQAPNAVNPLIAGGQAKPQHH